jgi:hypothetical protein
MSTGAVTAVVIVVIVIVALVAWIGYDARRRQLRSRFGAEYDRLVSEYGSRRKADAELAARQRRVRGLSIRELDPAARTRYTQEWAAAQERFVDDPQGALTGARRLVIALLNERGYPAEHTDEVLADLSVDHAKVVDDYRVADAMSERASTGTASTEDLRQAMIHYRAIFNDVLSETREPAVPDGSARPATDGSVPSVTDDSEPAATDEPEPPAPDESEAAAPDDTARRAR